MAEGARVDSISALTDFKAVLWKFREAAERALGDAESEMQRVLLWLETEQDMHWQHQIRKCQETVVRCKEAVRMKKIFKDASGRQQSAVDEEKALQIAVRKLQEAEQKLAAVKKWSRQLQKEIGLYKGSVQRFATTVQSEIPAAAAHLESLAAKLDAYAALAPDGGVSAGAGGSGGISGNDAGSMARAVDAKPHAPQLLPGAPRLSDEQQAAILKVPGPREALAPESKVTLHAEAETSARVIARREADGWSIIPVESDRMSSPSLIFAGTFLEARPDFRELLTLPLGFSVIIGPEGVAAIYDVGGTDVWSSVRREQPQA